MKAQLVAPFFAIFFVFSSGSNVQKKAGCSGAMEMVRRYLEESKFELVKTIRANKQQERKNDCSGAMAMVQNYLRESKLELLKNINAAKQQACNSQDWKKVDPSMVAHAHQRGATHKLTGDAHRGLRVEVTVTDKSCKKAERHGSHFVIHFKGNWTQIMYTQRFLGSAKCWSIFGKEKHSSHKHVGGVEEYSPSLGDIIFGEVNMGSKKEHKFGGLTSRCDDNEDNFWHIRNGSGERRATVMLRRSPNVPHSGISTHTACGTPSYILEDIYVLM